jgi:hypothetical protein
MAICWSSRASDAGGRCRPCGGLPWSCLLRRWSHPWKAWVLHGSGSLSPARARSSLDTSLRGVEGGDPTTVASAQSGIGANRPARVMPSYATHYHLAGRAPFLNLSDLSRVDLEEVFAGLERDRRSVGSQRVFGRRYMELRQRTEARLRQLFVAAGGRPERVSPHYFVLGSSRWFESLATNMQHVVLALTRMPSVVTCCTYPDTASPLWALVRITG